MLPGQVLSTVVIPGNYLPPDDLDPSKIEDYELGGVALQDTTQGIRFQVWRLFLQPILGTNSQNVCIEASNTPAIVLFSGLDVSEINLAFDQNMNPFVAFVENGLARYWWFDTVAGMQVFSNLAAGVRSPKCCLDDKKDLQDATSDVILSYVRSDNQLCFRAERDRYLVEYPLLAGVTQDLIRIGMTDVNRVQFAIGVIDDPALVVNTRVTVTRDRRIRVGGDVRRIVGFSYG